MLPLAHKLLSNALLHDETSPQLTGTMGVEKGLSWLSGGWLSPPKFFQGRGLSETGGICPLPSFCHPSMPRKPLYTMPKPYHLRSTLQCIATKLSCCYRQNSTLPRSNHKQNLLAICTGTTSSDSDVLTFRRCSEEMYAKSHQLAHSAQLALPSHQSLAALLRCHRLNCCAPHFQGAFEKGVP